MQGADHRLLMFLSDLCGREAWFGVWLFAFLFLSDLCGREDNKFKFEMSKEFLSDLCGREVGYTARR